MAEYRFEDLGDDGFQHLVQALLLRLHPDLSVPPVRQPDGGHDAFLLDETGIKVFSYQVKWVKDQREERDPVKWLMEVIKKEEANLRRMKAAGTQEWWLVTNVSGTAHQDVGTIDRLNAHLAKESKRLGLRMKAWWRDEVSRAVDSAPPELKFAYPDMLVGADVFRALITTHFMMERKNNLIRVLRSVASLQWGEDNEVRFKHGELDGVSLTSLFVDIPAASAGDRQDTSLPTKLDTGIRVLTPKTAPKPMVLLGAPGQGKSTLVQFTCQIHRAALLGKEDPLKAIGAGPIADINRIPYRIDLRIYSLWVTGYDPFVGEDGKGRRRRGEPVGVESFIAHTMTHASGGVKVTPDDVQFLFDWLPSFVAFDGLDEVAEVTNRKKVVDEIQGFHERTASYRGTTRIVVTARPSYASAPEPRTDQFSYYELLPLTDELRAKYLTKWSASQNLNDQDTAELRRVFKARSAEPHVIELATNPMQLAILLFLIYRRGESVPTNRTALYASYMELFLDRETSKNSIVKMHRRTVERVTAYIGWHLHAAAESKGGTGRATKRQLTQLVKHYLVDLDEDPRLVDALFTAVTQRAWVLTSRTEGYFEFEVQPIREYFAAKHLFVTAPSSIRNGSGVDRFDRLLALMHRPYWLNVTRFMAGMFDDGMVATVADRVEDLIDGAPRPFWSRLVARVLLEDGVFDAATRPRQRVIERSYDPVGIVENASRSPRGKGLLTLDHGGQATVDFIRRSISEQPDDPLSVVRARVLGRYAVPPQGAFDWWNREFNKIDDDGHRRRWLSLIGPLRIQKSITSDFAATLADSAPGAAAILLQSGVNPGTGSELAKIFLELVLNGDDRSPRGASLATNLALVCDPTYLNARGSKRPSEDFEDDDQNEVDVGVPDRTRNSALTRVKNDSEFGTRIANTLRIRSGRRGTTLMWSELANAIEDEYGSNWLSMRIISGAAADRSLTSGLASRAGAVTRTAFGPNSSSTTLLSDLLRERDNANWWEQSASRLSSDLDRQTWILAIATCADEDILCTSLTTIATVLEALPNESMARLLHSIQAIAVAPGTRTLTAQTTAAALSVSPKVASLLLPLGPVSSSAQFDDQAKDAIKSHRSLFEAYVRTHWKAIDDDAALDEGIFKLLALCGPEFHLRFRQFTLDQNFAEYALSEPTQYPMTLLRIADEAINRHLVVEPLADVAEREEWFIVPD